MAALTTGRITKQMDDSASPNVLSLPMATTAKIYLGSIVCVNASGYAVKGSTSTTLKAVGMALRNQPDANLGGVPGSYLENTGANGAMSIDVKRGCFKFDNDGDDLVVQADLFSPCYITDDHTVCHTGTGKSVAGKVVQLDSDGVWVWIDPGFAGATGATGPTGPTGPAA